MTWAKEISEGAHVGTTTLLGVPGAAGVPRWVVPTWCTPPLMLFALKIQKNSEKNRIKFLGHPENFYFWVIFFIAREIQKTDKAWHFILFN
jgi:hypothetical protein